MSISKKVEKQTVVYPYNRISYGNKNEQSIDMCYYMDEPWKYYTKWKKKLLMRDLLYSTSHFIILHLY